ncbi:hypothetical protein [Kitasatospora sp. NPDC018619]|uniref:hypothetical protein n=1 Tax=unclassified Kitasatospora TaxID=2633591 RepID=UPI00378C176D
MDASHSDGEITRTSPEGSPVRDGSLRSGFRDAFRRRRPVRAGRSGRSGRSGREWAGWLLAAVGAVLCVLGWYGASGERFVEQQVPYLASSTIPGAALIVSGAVLVALRPPPAPPGHPDLTDRRVERLYELLVEPDPGPAPPGPVGRSAGPDASAAAAASAASEEPAGTDGAGEAAAARGAGWLAVPGGTRYHRPDCPLVTGKEQAAPVGAEAVGARGLTPCPLCSPAPTGPGPTRPDEPTPPSG